MSADPMVKETLLKLAALYESKNGDYSDGPWDTLEASQELGVHPVINMLCRVNEKFKRVKKLLKKPTEGISNESLEDSFLDMALYLVLAYVYLKQDEKRMEEIVYPHGKCTYR